MALANIALDLLGQARLLLARAGGRGAGRSGRHRRPDEDALAYFRDADEFRNVALAELRRTATSRRRSPGCWSLSTLAARALRPAARLPRPGARRDRREGRQGADLPPRLRRPWVVRLGDGTAESHRRVQDGAGRGRGRCSAELFTATDVERRLAAAGVAVDPADSRRGRRGARPGAGPGHAAGAGLAGRRRAARPRRAARRAAGRAARRAAEPGPRPPGGDMVTVTAPVTPARTRARSPRRCTDPELPMLTLADLGVLRDVAAERRHRRRRDHPDLLGLPGDGRDARRPRARAAGAGFARRRGPHRALARLDHRLDHRRRAAASSPSTASPRPARAARAAPARSRCTSARPARRCACPRCGSPDTEEISRFGATACKALRRCRACREPFEHVKEI